MHSLIVWSVYYIGLLLVVQTLSLIYETRKIYFADWNNYWEESKTNAGSVSSGNSNGGSNSVNGGNAISSTSSTISMNRENNVNTDNAWSDLQLLANEIGFGAEFLHSDNNNRHYFRQLRSKRKIIEYDEIGNRVYNVGVLMASHLGMFFVIPFPKSQYNKCKIANFQIFGMFRKFPLNHYDCFITIYYYSLRFTI